MIRLMVICEGETEHTFVTELLAPYFLSKGIICSAPLIKKSMGGIVPWSGLKDQIIKHLHEKAYVTTFIDLYGIKDSYFFPKWQDSKAIQDKYKKIEFVESAMRDDIGSSLFIPYVQLHEFEALLFCKKEVFGSLIPPDDFVDEDELDKVIDQFPNPELINNSFATSPSHRIMNIIKGYEKELYGFCIAQETGLNIIRDKCKHFDEWICRLECLSK